MIEVNKVGGLQRGNLFMSKVSHVLNELKQNGEILTYFKFSSSIHNDQQIADHMIITKSNKVIFVEEKSTKKSKIYINSIRTPHQIEFNRNFRSNPLHIYLISIKNKKKELFILITEIDKITQKTISFDEISNKNDNFVFSDNLETMIKKIIEL